MREFDGRFDRHLQLGWDPEAPAVFSVDPGEEFGVWLHDSSTGQLTPESDRRALGAWDLTKVDAVAGPVEVRGARPGDALDVEILEVTPGLWGWSGVFRDFGWLRGRFDDDLVIWNVGRDSAVPVRGFLRRVEIPLSPMIGVVGVAPESGRFPLIPPQRFGGNMDHRWHAAGSTVRLPVFREGAKLGLGDPHGVQGDGEVCGTGIEVPAHVRLRATLRPGLAPPMPRVVRSRSIPEAGGPWYSALGIAPTLHDGVAAALDNLLRWLSEGGWSEKEAYLLASLLGRLRLAEVVDLPNYVVAMDFPATFGEAPPAGRD